MRHPDLKQHIIQTASDLFYKNGYNATGINEIIAKSEIAKATLYSHFRSKEDICIAYLKFKNSTFLQEIESYSLAKPAGKSQILALFDFLLEFFRDKDFNGCWCIKTVAEIPRENDRIRQEIQSQKEAFLDLISNLVKGNMQGLSITSEKSITRQIYLLYECAVAESHLHQMDWPIHEAKKICTQLLN